jgi:cystathionine beta-synthase
MQENGFLDVEDIRASSVLGRKRAGMGELLYGELHTTVRQALAIMTDNGITQLPIMEGQDCIGSVRESRLMSFALEQPDGLELPLSEVMEHPFPVVDESEPMDHVTSLFSRKNEAVLVRRSGKLEGIITRYDVIQHLSGR